jgi:DUF971 family protein
MPADPRRDVPGRLSLDLKVQRLVVGWLDGHESVYPGAYLRLVCPCAACRGHAPGEVVPPAWEQVKDVTVQDAVPVGGYGLQFSFSDGHSSGIYAFDRLRAACPCPTCDPQGAAARAARDLGGA